MDKVAASAAAAVADIPDGASLAVGGFGLSGVPNVLIEALYAGKHLLTEALPHDQPMDAVRPINPFLVTPESLFNAFL